MKKLSIILLLVLVMVFCLSSIAYAKIIDSGTCGYDLTWTLDSDGLLTISGTGEMADYISYNPPWYDYRSSIVSVSIGDSVTSIGDSAFDYCHSLTSLTIPNSVTSIGNWALAGCSSLTSMILPTSVTSIGEYTFCDCDGLTSVTIPNSVTSMGVAAFYSCQYLTSATIGSGLTGIADYAFYGCERLTSITIPDSVTSIGDSAFSDCDSLTGVTIPDSVNSIGDSAFHNCRSLTGVTIPDGVTNIGESTFFGCSSLSSVTIPDSVTSIGDSAFSRCRSLTSVTIPDGVTSIGDHAFNDCDSLTSVTIPDSVTSIGDRAFCYCRSLTSVTIPDGVTSIGDHAFEICDRLTGINVGSGNADYSSLDGVLFNKDKTELICCPAGKSGAYVIPGSVTSIGDHAFWYCERLTSMTIPGCVTSIGESTFSDCSSLTSVIIPDSVTSIGDSAFSGCISLTGVTIPDSVTSIGEETFRWCERLTYVTIPDSVTSIGHNAFYDCNSLKDVYYTGTPEKWDEIEINGGNEPLDNEPFYNATIHYNYIDNHFTVTVDQSGDNWQDGELHVPYGGDAELEVIASADEGDLTYRWVKVCEGGDMVENGTLPSTGDTQTINDVTRDGLYVCYVTDMYGTERYAAICIRVGGELEAQAVGDDSYSLEAGSPVSLHVRVTSGYTDEIIYKWSRYADYCYMDIEEENSDTLEIVSVDQSASYECEVRRPYYNYDHALSEGYVYESGYESTTVWFGVCVDNGFSIEPADSTSVHVPYGESSTLKVLAHATDTTGITYQWIRYTYDEEGNSLSEELDETGDSLYTGPITAYSTYRCRVRDKYGNDDYVYFYVHVDNHFSVSANTASFDEAGFEYDNWNMGKDLIVYVPADQPVTLTIDVTAEENDGITYEWTKQVYDENGDWIRDEVLDDTNETVIVGPITVPSTYWCRVCDKYGNEDSVWFSIHVDNGLSVIADTSSITEAGYLYENGSICVPLNASVTLKVKATATEMEGVTYEWTKIVYDENSGMERAEVLSDTDDTVIAGPITAYSTYMCRVRDKYGNEESEWFSVYLDNKLSISIDTDTIEESSFRYDNSGGASTSDIRVFVPLNQPVTLKVDVTADELDGVVYEWTRTVYNGSGSYGMEEILAEKTNTLIIDSINTYCNYRCCVRDKYGNVEGVCFGVHVENDFSVSVDTSQFIEAGYHYEYNNYNDNSYTQVCAPLDASVTLRIKATASDPAGITYQWNVLDYVTDTYDSFDGTDCLTIDNVTTTKHYSCYVSDRYNNYYYVSFYVVAGNILNAEAVGGPLVSVDYGGTATLQVRVTADDMTGITYKWDSAYYSDNNFYPISTGGYYNNDSDTLTIEDVTEHRLYYCWVSDQYGNNEYVPFEVFVNNDFSATAYGTDSRIVEMEVPVGGSASLKVDAKATDSEGIRYKWASVGRLRTDENGEEIVDVATGTDLTLINGPGSNDSLELSNITKSKWYFSRVIDKFSNMIDVFFHVKVPNELAVTPSQMEITVPQGASQILTVTPSALDSEGMRYTWTKQVFNSQGELLGTEMVPCSESKLLLENVTEPAIYRCRVTDRFDNYVNSTFSINIIAPAGYIVTLNDLTNGAASITGIASGNGYSGETTFNVTCVDSCAVLFTTDGENYTRLTGTAGDNGYRFTVDVTQKMTIVVALKGDVNLDGVLKNQDVTMAKAANLGKRTLSTLQEMVADVTGDGVFKNQDITKFKAALLGKTTLNWDI